MTDQVEDLKSKPFPMLVWDTGNLAESLNALAEFACNQAQNSTNWYFVKRGRKQLGGMVLRVGAIVSTAVAGVIPILGEIFEDGGVPALAPGWSAVFIALAGLLVLLDKFWGFTSAWIRFIQTGQALSVKLDTFRLDIEGQRFGWVNGEPDSTQVVAWLKLCRDFMNEVHAAVRTETDQWAAEFQSVVKQIDEASKEAVTARAQGAIDLLVTNGDLCEDGWRLCVDSGPPQTVRGKTASLTGLSAKIHSVAVEGKIGEKSQRATKSVTVAGGQIANVSVTLE